jgi:tetratricopeptide (TPR) repeat protein
LNGSQETIEEAISLDTESGDRRQLGYHYATLGDVLEALADLPGARKARAEALKIRTALGEKGELANARVALASSSIEEGRPAEAELEVRAAIIDLNALGLPDDVGAAYFALLRALLASRKIAEAGQSAREASAVVAKSHDRMVQFEFAIAAARVEAKTGDRSVARAALTKTIAETAKDGFLGQQLEARLALAELEVDLSGTPSLGRKHLAAIEKDAAAKGFLLLTGKARSATER